VTVVRIQLQAEGWKVRAAGNEGTRTTAGADIFDITTSHAVDESKLQQCGASCTLFVMSFEQQHVTTWDF